MKQPFKSPNIYSHAKSLKQLHRDFWQMMVDEWVDYANGYTENSFFEKTVFND
jgi:hypothetical protein